jgi:hypothetical protein
MIDREIICRRPAAKKRYSQSFPPLNGSGVLPDEHAASYNESDLLPTG